MGTILASPSNRYMRYLNLNWGSKAFEETQEILNLLITAWLEGAGVIPEAVTAVNGLEENLRLQDKVTQRMKNFRHIHGALNLETIEAKPVFDGDQIRTLEIEEENRAKEIIEDFMIAANGVTARYLSSRKFPSIRRVVRTPKRWDRIAEIANEHGSKLPGKPDSKALEEFLIQVTGHGST